ncbi:hypothetical protein Ciccas_011539 [Cichlidogyrus casuarinus]|uniref:Uncharacterized protein n=1 Tax=Cichlidogyrus casuarinus TaxID=1844966 RepID=A0ABD2PSM7_9PLAT
MSSKKPAPDDVLQSRNSELVANLLKSTSRPTIAHDCDYTIAQLRGADAERIRAHARGQIDFCNPRPTPEPEPHYKCKDWEAVENVEKGTKGTDLKAVMGYEVPDNSIPMKPKVKYDEAQSMYDRDHFMDKGNMVHVLKRGTSAGPEGRSDLLGNRLLVGPEGSHDMNSRNMTAIIHRVKNLQVTEPQPAPRCLTKEAAPYASREGTLMADRLGEKKSFDVECIISEQIVNFQDVHLAPRVKFEGRDFAEKGKGVMGALITGYGLQQERPQPRLKYEAVDIASAQSGAVCRTLLTDAKCGAPDDQGRRSKKPVRTRVARLALGHGAKECFGTPKKKLFIRWK